MEDTYQKGDEFDHFSRREREGRYRQEEGVLDILQKNLRIAVLSFLILQGQIFSEGVSTRSHIVVVCYTAISHIESGTYVL